MINTLFTIGVKVSRKSIIVPVDEKIVEVRLMVWDLAGSQEFTAVSASYLRGASGAIIVCDMTRAETVARLRTYADDLHRVMPQAHIVIAANKMDLTDQFQVTEADIAEQASALNTSYFQTSAKIGDDVDHAFRCLSVLLLKH
ncbi:MAG: Rab family GTPase [Caldilineaceae bacterium]